MYQITKTGEGAIKTLQHSLPDMLIAKHKPKELLITEYLSNPLFIYFPDEVSFNSRFMSLKFFGAGFYHKNNGKPALLDDTDTTNHRIAGFSYKISPVKPANKEKYTAAFLTETNLHNHLETRRNTITGTFKRYRGIKSGVKERKSNK